MTTYLDELIKAMTHLGEKKDTVFIGQSILYPGTGLYQTLKNVPGSKKIELPVQEDMQMGMSIGMSLDGLVPISIFPRLDFLILGLNQLVNHLDKMEQMSDGQFKPKVIIRSAVGSVKPLFPGPQHSQDITDALRLMCTNIHIVKLMDAKDIFNEYKQAYMSDKSSVIIELPDLYKEEI